MPTIFRKTAKGVAEIETRAHRLTPRLRGALIVVDGKRHADELRGLLAQQADESLATLLEQGFIEAAGESAPPRPPREAAAPPPPPKPAPAPPADGFLALRREAVRNLIDLVGPMGEALALRMERSANADELRPMIEVAAQTIANTRGRAKAAEYAERFSAL
jgi:hypothetical protein